LRANICARDRSNKLEEEQNLAHPSDPQSLPPLGVQTNQAGSEPRPSSLAPTALIDDHFTNVKKKSGARFPTASRSQARTQLTPEEERALVTEAKDASAALDAHGDDYIILMLCFGKIIKKRKASIPHGEFKEWCLKHLGRSSSCCSNYRRLYEEEAILQDVLAWAREQNHKWAYCRSVERLLKLIADFKKANDGTTSPTPPRKARLKPNEVIADLQHRLKEAENETVALRDLVPAEICQRARALASAAATGDATAKEALAAFAQACHSRLRDLLCDEISSQQEVSAPASDFPRGRHPGIEKDQETGTKVPSAWARPSPDRYINGETHDIPVYLAGPRWPLQRSRAST